MRYIKREKLIKNSHSAPISIYYHLPLIPGKNAMFPFKTPKYRVMNIIFSTKIGNDHRCALNRAVDSLTARLLSILGQFNFLVEIF